MSTAAAYASPWEHVADELERLDLRLRLRLLEQRGRQPESPFDQLRGLVLSQEEVSALLSPSQATAGKDGPDGEIGQLAAALEERGRGIEERREASRPAQAALPLPRLARLFRLSPLEEQCLVICLAPELDRKYDKLYAFLQDDVTRKRPSVDLVLSLLCGSPAERLEARTSFAVQAPLLRHGLVHLIDGPADGPLPLVARSLKLDDRIAELLLGDRRPDARLGEMVRLVQPAAGDEAITDEAGHEVRERVRSFLRASFQETTAPIRVVFHVHGPYGSGRRALAEAGSRELGVPLLVADGERLAAGPLPLDEALRLLAREALLQPGILCLEGFDALIAPLDNSDRPARLRAFAEAVELYSSVTFLLGERPWRPQGLLDGCRFVPIELPLPDNAARVGLWQAAMAAHGLDGDEAEIDAAALASKFRFTAGQMRDALAAARDLARWREPEDGRIAGADVYAACRAQSSPKLAALARRIEPRYRWGDLVLPDDQTAQLHEICDQVRHRHLVLGRWGFGRKLSLGKGLSALFSGPPGTGKTMAAEVLSSELGLELYKIDLSQVVSKYIGETEKNLDRIFSAAENSHVILFFDEADALFGKRSEVRDSHDRYANVEISYLLQKMDEYAGVAILATNLRQHMDDAFTRRLQALVEFPFPDERYRERIWQVIFPAGAPLGDDVDLGALARDVRLAGGNIKNIGLAAAYYAAADGAVIRMPHLRRAAHREYQKLGRTWAGAAASAISGNGDGAEAS